MHALRQAPDQSVPGVRGGFIHIPYAPEQAAHHPGAPSLSTSVVTEALRLAVATALTVERDAHFAAGATH
jgi:pyroglutamyl-peptidase